MSILPLRFKGPVYPARTKKSLVAQKKAASLGHG